MASGSFFVIAVALVAMCVVDALPARSPAQATRRGSQRVGVSQAGKPRSMTTTMTTLVADAASANASSPVDDSNTMSTLLSHCPVLCSPGKKKHPLGHLVPKYTGYAVCMDECICAAYCYLLDMAGELEYEECFVACSEAAPFSSDGELVRAIAPPQH